MVSSYEAYEIRAALPVQVSYCRRQLKVGLCVLFKYLTAVYARAASPIQVSVYARAALLFNSLAVNARTVSYLSVSLPKSVYVRAASHILSVSLRQGCIAYPRVWLLMPGLCLQSKCLTVYARAASPIQVSVYVRAASPIQVSVYARAASPFKYLAVDVRAVSPI